MPVRIITGKDVESLLTMKDTIGAVEEAFRQKALGKVEMPPKVYVFIKEHAGDYRVMPAYMPSIDAAGVKVVNVHVKNRERGLPTVMATILLLKPETGEPIAVIDGTLITSMRTGAAGALAVREMARKGSGVVAFVGAGVQARFQLLGIKEVLGTFRARAYDVSSASSKSFAEFALKNGIKADIAQSVKECVSGADVIVTTTPATGPVVMREWVSDGAHINAIGADAPGKEELDPKILLDARVIVDDMEQATHSGEVNVPISKGIYKPSMISGELGDVLIGKVKGRGSEKEITVFDSTGLAIQDIATASAVLRRAEEKGVGILVDMVSR